MSAQAHPCAGFRLSLVLTCARSNQYDTLSLAQLNRRNAVVPVVAAGAGYLVQVGYVGSERHAVARVVIVVEDGSLPATGNADRRDAVIPVGACATTAREIVEVLCIPQHRPAVSFEVGVLVDDNGVARRGGVVVATARS